MAAIPLLLTTGDSRRDARLRDVVALVEEALPGRIRSYYLFGSVADGSAVATSDLDLFLVAATPLTADEEARLADIARTAMSLGGGVDLAVIDEGTLLREGHFRIAAGGRLLHGVELRPRIPPTSLSAYLRRYAQAPWDYIAQVLRREAFLAAGYLAYPLRHPDPGGEFYGYDRPRLPHGDEPLPNIHALVATACWIATVAVALHAGRMVPAKSASVRNYGEVIGDAWAPWLEELYDTGRRRWEYRVPDDPAGRRHLRDLCGPMLAFENHYLRLYRRFLLSELGQGAEARLAAARRLGEATFPDPALREALAGLANDDDQRMREAASVARSRIAREEAR